LKLTFVFFENIEKIYKLQLKAKARWNCLIALGFGCNLSLLSGFGVVVFVFLSLSELSHTLNENVWTRL
jgi:hypothetical protein